MGRQRKRIVKLPKKKLPTILFLGGASLLVGVLGFFIDLYLTVSRIVSDMEKTLIYFIHCDCCNYYILMNRTVI